MSEFQRELESLINRYSRENGSHTPDFVLAEYLSGCLAAFDAAVGQRDAWYGVRLRPDNEPPAPEGDQ